MKISNWDLVLLALVIFEPAIFHGMLPFVLFGFFALCVWFVVDVFRGVREIGKYQKAIAAERVNKPEFDWRTSGRH